MSEDKTPYDRGYPLPCDDETLIVALTGHKVTTDPEKLTGSEIALFNNLPAHLGGIAARKALSIIRSQESNISTLERQVQSSDAGRDAAFNLIVEAHNERDAAHDALEVAKAEISDLLAQRHALESENNAAKDRREADRDEWDNAYASMRAERDAVNARWQQATGCATPEEWEAKEQNDAWERMDARERSE